MPRKADISYRIDFEPVGRRVKCRAGESLLDCARRSGVGLNSICGGRGTCRTCRVQVISGRVSAPAEAELAAFSSREIGKGWRLACQTYPCGDVKLGLPPESLSTAQRTQVEGLEVKIAPRPATGSYRLKVTPPTLEEPQADAGRLLAALRRQHTVDARRFDIQALRRLSSGLGLWHNECRVAVRGDEVIAVGPPDSRHLGLAVDLGTTKIAGYLVDLSDGRTLAAGGMMNPQISYGEDVISRMNLAIASPEQGDRLRELAAGALNELAVGLCTEAGVSREDIMEAVVVGNTVMHHLFLGLPLGQLARPPFVPSVARALDVKARDLGLSLAAGACVHLLPNIAGFVGGDHVAMLLATGAGRSRSCILALDIGTNTEVSLVSRGRIFTVSCASGPAFEGGHIEAGMRAAAGAIERLRIEDGVVRYQTVDGAPPAGICGSGLLDAVAQLHLAGAIDEGGRMQPRHPLVSDHGRQRRVVLAGAAEGGEGLPVAITQADVRELQLAKAAIRTGIQVLLEAAGCAEEDIRQVIIAGAFGSYIDIASAIDTGLLPALPPRRFLQVGNAAGTGARLALISRRKRAEAAALAARLEYIELAGAPGFNQTFVEASYLGRYRLEEGRREPVTVRGAGLT